MITDSMMLTIGITMARVLGFGFSFILARQLSPENFGFIQYCLTLSGIAAIGTQPLVQHALARYVAKNAKDEAQLAATLHALWYVLLGVTGISILIAVPLLVLSDRFNIGVLVIFLGMTLFYSYYGLARGFMASKRLLAAYLGSNLVQIIAIVILYQFGSTDSPTPALIIYGLSYLLPLIILQVWQPLPVHFKFSLPQRAIVVDVLRFSVPLWLSHAAYMAYAGMDVLLIQHYTDTASVGLYTLTKTLVSLFSFVPMGLMTIVLPKVASLPQDQHTRIVKRALLMAAVANGAALLVFLVGYPWFISNFFSPEYLVPLHIVLMLAVGEILLGFHSIITAMHVGGDNPQLETISRAFIMLTSFTLGFLLIPRLGLLGAGIMMLCCAIAGVATYTILGLVRRKRLNYALAHQ
jgi:O-antigen/teichoic acid export membrane protein